eukprot:m.211532 g.211532  ORF g.211532 m.211532 type:complete len:761 (-) comp18466_c0_seq1:1208-3490(-)
MEAIKSFVTSLMTPRTDEDELDECAEEDQHQEHEQEHEGQEEVKQEEEQARSAEDHHDDAENSSNSKQTLEVRLQRDADASENDGDVSTVDESVLHQPSQHLDASVAEETAAAESTDQKEAAQVEGEEAAAAEADSTAAAAATEADTNTAATADATAATTTSKEKEKRKKKARSDKAKDASAANPNSTSIATTSTATSGSAAAAADVASVADAGRVAEFGALRALMLSDINGNLSSINHLAAKTRANIVICTGTFGFFDEHTPKHLLPKNMHRGPEGKGPAHGELTDFLRKRKALVLPVYVVWGSSADVRVVGKFRTGEYVVPNLMIVDERHTYKLGPYRLCGLGGEFVPERLTDSGEGDVDFVAGEQNRMWISLLQVGDLRHTMSLVQDQGETKIFISHANPIKEPLIAQLAICLNCDIIVFDDAASPITSHFVPSSIFSLNQMSKQFSTSERSIAELWALVKDQVRQSADGELTRLFDQAIKVTSFKPSVGYMNSVWHIGLGGLRRQGTTVLQFDSSTVQVEGNYAFVEVRKENETKRLEKKLQALSRPTPASPSAPARGQSTPQRGGARPVSHPHTTAPVPAASNANSSITTTTTATASSNDTASASSSTGGSAHRAVASSTANTNSNTAATASSDSSGPSSLPPRFAGMHIRGGGSPRGGSSSNSSNSGGSVRGGRSGRGGSGSVRGGGGRGGDGGSGRSHSSAEGSASPARAQTAGAGETSSSSSSPAAASSSHSHQRRGQGRGGRSTAPAAPAE